MRQDPACDRTAEANHGPSRHPASTSWPVASGQWPHEPRERAVAAATPALHPPTALPVTPIRYITSTTVSRGRSIPSPPPRPLSPLLLSLLRVGEPGRRFPVATSPNPTRNRRRHPCWGTWASVSGGDDPQPHADPPPPPGLGNLAIGNRGPRAPTPRHPRAAVGSRRSRPTGALERRSDDDRPYPTPPCLLVSAGTAAHDRGLQHQQHQPHRDTSNIDNTSDTATPATPRHQQHRQHQQHQRHRKTNDTATPTTRR